MLDLLKNWWLDIVKPPGSARVRIQDGKHFVEIKQEVGTSSPDSETDEVYAIYGWVSVATFDTLPDAEDYIRKNHPKEEPQEKSKSPEVFLYY